MNLLDPLLSHDRWGTGIVFDACTSLTDEQFSHEFESDHENIHDTFRHLISNLESSTTTMYGAAADEPDIDWSRAHLRHRWERAYAAFDKLVVEIGQRNCLDDNVGDNLDHPRTFDSVIKHVLRQNEGDRNRILYMRARFGLEEVPKLDHSFRNFVHRSLDRE